MLAVASSHWLASAGFAGGFLLGFWIGARYDLRRKRDR